MSLLSSSPTEPLLLRLRWPRLLTRGAYLSARPVIPVALAGGCPWGRCRFCPDRGREHVPYGVRGLQGLLDTLPEALRAQRPVLHVLDSASPPRSLLTLAERSLEAGLGGFYGFARPSPALVRGKTLARLAEGGCLLLQLGVESGSGGLLRRMDKGLSPSTSEAVLRAAAEAGIRTYAYLLFGLPTESDEDRDATRQLLERCDGALDFVNFSIFNLPLSCELARSPEDYGMRLRPLPEDEPLRLYRGFDVPDGDPRRIARRFLGELRRDPRIAAAFRRTPRWLRAAHLALMKLPGRNAALPLGRWNGLEIE